MIPKIIHFCWLSGDEYPEIIQKCIATWQEKLPDYEFVLWDTNRFNIESNLWAKQAFEAKKYAFAADYIRLYAVYTHGGIYLDTDIEVLKGFDDLLDLPYFIGSEGDGIIEAGIFGAEKGADWLAACLEYYKNRPFVKEDGKFDILTLPRVMMTQIGKTKKIIEMEVPEVKKVKQLLQDNDSLILFPYEFFCAKNHGTGVVEKTENTYSIHHFAMSWIPARKKILSNFKKGLIKVFGVKTINVFIGTLKLRELKSFIYKKE